MEHKVNEICMAHASIFTTSAVRPVFMIRGNSIPAVLWTLPPEMYLLKYAGLGNWICSRIQVTSIDNLPD